MFEFDVLMNQRGFIGNQVARVFESAIQAGTFGKIPLKQLLKEPEVGRDSRGNYNRTNFTFEDTTFGTKEKGIEIPIDRRQSKMYRSFFDFETVCTATALDIVLRAQEKRVADMIFNATTFAARTTGVTNEWDDFTNATPVTDVNNAVMAIWQACGLWANALIINRKVFRNFTAVADILTSAARGDGDQGIYHAPDQAEVINTATCPPQPESNNPRLGSGQAGCEIHAQKAAKKRRWRLPAASVSA